jgi:hypothetical protein
MRHHPVELLQASSRRQALQSDHLCGSAGGIPFYVIRHIPQIITTKMMLWCVCKHLHFKEINDKPCETLRCPIVRKTHMGLSCSIFRHNHILHSLSSLIPNYQVAGFNMSKNRLGICVSCVCCLGLSIYIYCPAASIARTISLSLSAALSPRSGGKASIDCKIFLVAQMCSM